MAGHRITDDIHEEPVLLISCLGDEDTGGGLFCYDGERVERIDRLSTTGISVAENHFVRALRNPDASSPGEILIYDFKGVQSYLRIDDLWEPHDILLKDNQLIAASPLQNSVFWISLSGAIVRRWRAGGSGDAWHLNCFLVKDERLLMSAFGRFAGHREWIRDKHDPTGIVFDLETGEHVLEGLSHPHNPRFVDGAWVICNSLTSELLRIDQLNKTVTDRVALRGYPRGIGVTNDFVFVGESANRTVASRPRGTAQVAIVCRRNWRLLDRLDLPCSEIYDVVVAPRSLADGARHGFRTNPRREAEQDQYAMFDAVGVEPVRLWATGDPLPPQACKVKVAAELPQKMPRDSLVEVECRVENLGRAILVSASPNPVHISYKWLVGDRSRRIEMEGLRTRLPSALPPKNSSSTKMQIKTPSIAGEFTLLVTLVQEDVAWFDDLSDTNCIVQVIEVD